MSILHSTALNMRAQYLGREGGRNRGREGEREGGREGGGEGGREGGKEGGGREGGGQRRMRKRYHSKGTADKRKQTVLCTCTSHNYVECYNYTSTYTHALNMHTLYTHVPTQHVSLSTLVHSLQTQPLSDIIACTRHQ